MTNVLPLLLPIGALLLGVALLLLGSGLLSPLLAVRGSMEGFADHTLGLMGSAYFFGYVVGTRVTPPLIRRMGHVRAFAFLGAAVAAISLFHALLVDARFWMLLRMFTGLVLVGLYTIIESWLNSQAPPDRRSQVFAVYMAVNLASLAAAQQLLRLDSPANFTLFAVSAILVCFAVMPVTATRLPPPVLARKHRLSLRRVWRAAPVAATGAALSGLAMSAFWAMGPVYAARLGLERHGIAMFMSSAILGGAVLQWPIGHFSDNADRRRVLGVVAATAAVGGLLTAVLGKFGLLVLAGAFVFGGAAFAVYPLVVAHLMDHLAHDEILAGNSAVLLLHGTAAALGPAIAGVLMGAVGPAALPLYLATILGMLALVTILYARRRVDQIVEEPAHFSPMLRTSPTVMELITPEEEPDATGAEAPKAVEDDSADPGTGAHRGAEAEPLRRRHDDRP